MKWALVLVVAVAAGCGAAPPVWYRAEPGQTEWVLPLYRPLDRDEPTVPVFVAGQGPFEFALDPESPVTVIDGELAERLGLYRHGYVRLFNQRDKTVPRRTYEVLDLRTGDLRAGNIRVAAAPPGTLHSAGRRIDGILGGDLLSRTIVIDLDRDAGVARLALTGYARIPPGAVAIPAGLHRDTLRVAARVEGRVEVDLVVHIARRTTSLRRDRLAALGSPLAPTWEVVVDETGDAVTARERAHVGMLELDGYTIHDIAVIPYLDRRARTDIDYHGVLGQNVLSRYRTIVDRDRKRVYLAARDRDPAARAAERIARWGDALSRCRSVGCVDLERGPEGSVLVSREKAGPPSLEVLLDVSYASEAGSSFSGRRYVVLSPEQPSVTIPGTPAGIHARVLDVSPVPALGRERDP